MQYYYFNDEQYPFKVTRETLILTWATFYSDHYAEGSSVKQFFDEIPRNQKINILDIGAQSGLYTLFAKYLPQATFYSFEPYPPTFKLLLDNIALNEINNVIPHNIALSDKEGKTILNTCKSHFGLHTLGENPNRFTDIYPIEVAVFTIDKLFYEKNIAVDFIKIDTEGSEYYILMGGIKTIQMYRPVIQMEWNLNNMAQCNVEETQLKYLLDFLGYEKKSIENEEILFLPKKIDK